MTVLTTIIAMTDKADSGYLTSDLTTRQTKYTGLTALLTGSGDLTFIIAMASAVTSAQSLSLPDRDVYGASQPIWQALDNAYLSPIGYATLDAYLTAQNTPTPFQQMIGPNAAYLYWLYLSNGSAWRGNKTGTLLLRPGNVFPPVTALGSATVGAAGAITFVAGSAIALVNNTSTPAQGYAPAKGAICTGTTLINGTLSVTVTYSGQTSAGVGFTGHTATVTLDSLAVGATVTFTPPSGERISALTNIAASGSPSATSGAFSISSLIERITS